MEPVIFQEILLAHQSSFFQKEFYHQNYSPDFTWLSAKDQLVDACWNGVLREMLPELWNGLKINQISEGNQFLDVCFGKDDERNNTCFSLNPYFFLNSTRKN